MGSESNTSDSHSGTPDPNNGIRSNMPPGIEDEQSFVPDGFEVSTGLITPDFRLEPLGPEHNVADRDAWTSSIEHIQATPGFIGRSWPGRVMTLEENLADLERHANDFAQRKGF